DGVPATTWKTTDTTLSISYSFRGLHTITLEINEEYVVQKTITANVTVYEPVSIIIQAPMNVTENSTALIDITATSGVPGGQPLNGKNVVITLYDLSRDKAIGVFSVLLDSRGTYSFATDPLVWGRYEIQVEFLGDQDWFAQTTAAIVFYAVGQAQLAFSPPQSIIYNENAVLSASLHDKQGPIANKTISFWWQQGDSKWNALGTNITANSGETDLLWTPTLEPGNNYNLKAELLGSPELESVSVIKPITIGTRPPAILAVYSLLSKYNDTQIAAPGDYEVVVDIQETSPVDYQVFLTLNGQQISMTRINGTEYLYQNGTASELLTAYGDAFYVGTIALVANGIYDITIETEDTAGSKESLRIGSFAIVPPEIQAVWSLLPESNTSTVSLNRPYTVVVQVQEHSPMDYAVFLAVNGQKIPLNQQQGGGYTLQAPNGTTYFIPANESVLYAGILSFSTEGTYDIEILLEDERGFTQTWEIGSLSASITDDPGQKSESSNELEGNSDEKGLATSITAETVALLLLMVGSSGAVLFVGRPRRYKV
ncbi:MAG: hypothetical protein ACFFGZ_09285, partial [Candidatus Thorarchaeota archaeon]